MSYVVTGKERERAIARVWSKVTKTDGCWIWSGSVDKHGYARYGDGRHFGTVYAHLIIYKLVYGEIPDVPDADVRGSVVDHTCRNRACVNPDHLDVVSNQENIARGIVGEHNRIKTHCPHGHRYSRKNTRLKVQSGYLKRSCRTCENEQQRARRAARRRSV